jgi:acetyltransferase
MHGRAIGFSYLISCGNQAGTTVEDYLEYLVEDEATRVIGAFVEGLKQPAKLRRVAARAAELGKPIVMMKVGRSENARQATLAHTGSLAGTPEIVEALLRQCGIVQVHGLNEMVETLALFAGAHAYAGGWRVAALSGSGGECGMIADAAADAGLDMPPLSPASVARLTAVLPEFGRPRNPLDGTGAMYEDSRIYPELIDTLLHEDAVDVVAIHLNAEPPKPSGRTPSRDFSRVIRDTVRATPSTRPRLVLAFSGMTGNVQDVEVVQTLAEAGMPYLDGTEHAMRALAHLRAYRAFVERPPQPDEGRPPQPPNNGESPGTAAATYAGPLSTVEAMDLLAAYGIPLVPTRFAADADSAVAAAEALGYPVVLKIESPDVAHKTDVGGVRVGCADAAAVRTAYVEIMASVGRYVPHARLDGVAVQPLVTDGVEVILGVKADPPFGPAVVFGLGGVLVEVLHDVALRLPPLGLDEAQAMIAEIRGSALLRGVRGRPSADVAALADTLVRLGALAAAHADRLAALDLNPVLVLPAGRGVVAVDWLVEMA